MISDEAAEHYRGLHSQIEARRLAPAVSRDKWADSLPALYTTVNANCWDTGKHVCERPGHCCVRRICSWIRFPRRAVLRRHGRAWRIAFIALGAGHAARSLAHSVRDLRERAAKLRHAEGSASTCRRCQAPKTPATGAVLDASSMYEKVDAAQVILAAQFVVKVLSSKGYCGVLVHRERRLRGELWRYPGSYRSGAYLATWGDMLTALRYGLSGRYARFGDVVFEQVGGLPIGGPLGDLGAGLLLTLHEATWRQTPALRALHGYAGWQTAEDYDEAVAATRYVDDVVALSLQLCARCLAELVQKQHPGVPFVVEHTSEAGPLPWLDVVVYAERLPPHIAPALPERRWVLEGGAMPQTYRVPPYLGERHMDESALRSHVRSCLARFHQTQHAHREMSRAVLYEMLLLRRAGHPWSRSLRVWRSHSRDHRLAALVRRVCADVQARLTERQ